MLVLLATAALAADSDLDGVQDIFDYCRGEDDSVDIDGNLIADCDENMLAEFGMGTEASTTATWDRQFQNQTSTLLTWDPDDLHGYGSSGSVLFSDMSIGSAYMESIECIPLDAGQDYRLTGRFDAASPGDTVVYFGVLFHVDADCDMHWNGQGFYRFTYWTDFEIAPGAGPTDVAYTFPTPPAARYATVRVAVFTSGAGSRAWADSIALRKSTNKSGGDDDPGPPSFARSLARDGDNPSGDRSQGRDATD